MVIDFAVVSVQLFVEIVGVDEESSKPKAIFCVE